MPYYIDNENQYKSYYYNLMNPSNYLHTGDLVVLSYQGLSLSIQSLTQSVPTMKESLETPMSSYFLITTHKCLENSIRQEKSLASFRDDQIYYGQAILFYHFLSGKYLAYSSDIENKSSIQLTGSYKTNCQFSINPIFKCQTVVTRKIRAEQSIILAPMETFNRQGNISLVVLKNESRKSNRFYVCMKKNQHSMLNITRISISDPSDTRVNNIGIYKICNIETKKCLFGTVSQLKHRDIITFEKSINELGSYFDIRIKGQDFLQAIIKQCKILYNQRVYLHSWKQHKYLSINLIGDLCLTKQANNQSQFIFEPYSDYQLTHESVARIKHVQSDKYISINSQNDQIQIVSQAKLIDTCFIMPVPIQKLRVNIFVNDACKIIQRQLSEEHLSYRNKKVISKVLKQLTNFIFGESVTIVDFLSMKNQLNCKLSAKDQKLLADVGMIQTLLQLFKLLIHEATIKQSELEDQGNVEQKDRTQQLNIISYIMMNLTGMCLKNSANLRLLIQQLPFLYESMASTYGVIQCLYHLFKNSKQLLFILENTNHKAGKRQTSSFEVLLTMLSNQKFDIVTKCKILKLLQALIIVNEKQKILGHETCLLRFWQQRKLQNILLQTKSNDHHDLMIYLPQKQGFQELDEMLTLKRKYDKQLQLLKNQLQLICSMCLNSNSQTFIFFSDIITQDMILRYLKTNLQPDIKQIFMKLLIDIYLCKLGQNHETSKAFIIINDKKKNVNRFSQLPDTSLRERLISHQGEQLMQVGSFQISHSKTIEKIQNLILEATRKAITNQIIDSSFYMNIKALKNFLSLRILDQEEVRDFRALLTGFIANYTQHSFRQIQKKKITLQIINIIKDYINSETQEISEQFIMTLVREQVNANQIFNRFMLFRRDKNFFNNQIVANEFKFLPRLIKQSIKHQDIQIFIAANQLNGMLFQRQRILIRCLKNKIIIESNWSYNFYQRIRELKRQIFQQIQQFVSFQREPKKAELVEENLNRKLEQLNYMYFEVENENVRNFSYLVQNIYRQMDLFEIIVGFLNDSQKKFKEKRRRQSKIDVYNTCFEFISMFLRDNQQNFQRFMTKYLDIKFVFQHPDRGQIKFLNQLIKMPKARQLMMQPIIDCVMLSFQYNKQPTPYAILTLLNIMTYPHIEKERIEIFVESMIRNPKIFQWIFKITEKKGKYNFMWSYNPQDQNYHKDWIIYQMLVVKLLLIVLETSSERATFSLQIIKYIDLHKVINLLQCPDLLSSTSLQNLEGTLLKKQIMKLFQKIYTSEIEKQTEQIQNILAYIQSTFQNLTYIREDLMGASGVLLDQILKCSNDHESIIFEADIFPKSKQSIKAFQANFNPNHLIVVYYYPFIIRILDILMSIGSGESMLKRESTMLLDTIYRKYKDFVQHKLSYGEFNKYPKEYQRAIYAAEEMFKRKVGFSIEAQEDDHDYEGSQIQTSDIFLNRKIQNTIKCFQFASSKKQRNIYEAFITIFHSQQLFKHLRQEQQKYTFKLSPEQIQKMLELYQKCIQTRKQDLPKIMEMFEIFVMHNQEECRDLQFGHLHQKIMMILENQKQDVGNTKMQAYISTTTKIYHSKINRSQNPKVKQKQVSLPYKQPFLMRLCKEINLQKKLYSGSKLNEQRIIYADKQALVFQRKRQNLIIEEILVWIRNMIMLLPYKTKLKYSSLFFEIVDLLKTYNDFIREFNSKYITKELQNKINLCLSIIYHYIAGGKQKNILINYLIQRQIWNDLNLILSLDDSWNKNIQQLQDTIKLTFSKCIRSQVRQNSRNYLTQSFSIYQNSKKTYSQLISDNYFPLLPIKSLFSQLKSNVVCLLKQFNHYTLEIKQQLYSRMQISIINRNIVDIYLKHQKLFVKYDIPSVQISIDYPLTDQIRPLAQNLSIQNGIDMTAIKMHIEDVCSSGDVKNQYYNIRLDSLSSKKISSAFSSIVQFIRDFFLLFISCFLNLCRKNKKNREIVAEIQEKKLQQIIKFFLQRLARVQIALDNKLLYVDFMIRPECRVNKDINNKFIQKINFISMQLKLESIYRQGISYMFYYQNQIDFYRKFNTFTFITFLTKNFEIVTYINFGIIVCQNIFLIINSDSDQAYFVDKSLGQPFVWLQIFSTIGAALIMIAYLIKDFPLLIQNINLTLRLRSESYGSNYNNYNVVVKIGIKTTMVVLNPTFAYHIIYSVIVALVFYNKLFVALLLLDIYFTIPNLKNLLMSIWRPKLQLFLAIISFVLVQYFFSIFMFFNFKTQTDPYCQTLGSCFGFVFVTTYKAVGGFVGFLFEKQGQVIANVDFFEIFQDFYVVLVYQIFFALILAIIIDTFSLIRNEQSVRKQYLDSCCIVCNLDKTKFNSANLSFRSHIAISHNIWNYFYYYEYVSHKSIYKRTPYQRQIYLSRSANWLPTNTSKDIFEEQVDMKNT